MSPPSTVACDCFWACPTGMLRFYQPTCYSPYELQSHGPRTTADGVRTPVPVYVRLWGTGRCPRFCNPCPERWSRFHRRDSKVCLKVSFNTQFTKVDPLRCPRMVQHLQKSCLLPPTGGGGVNSRDIIAGLPPLTQMRARL